VAPGTTCTQLVVQTAIPAGSNDHPCHAKPRRNAEHHIHCLVIHQRVVLQAGIDCKQEWLQHHAWKSCTSKPERSIPPTVFSIVCEHANSEAAKTPSYGKREPVLCKDTAKDPTSAKRKRQQYRPASEADAPWQRCKGAKTGLTNTAGLSRGILITICCDLVDAFILLWHCFGSTHNS